MLTIATCSQCERQFDLLNTSDAEEWFYGHDCEPVLDRPEYRLADDPVLTNQFVEYDNTPEAWESAE